MLRFIVAYRWELLLLLWAPFLSNVAFAAMLPLAGFLYDRGWVDTRFVLYGYEGIGSLVEAGLLLALYARVRRLERPLLSLVWGYALLLAAVGGVFSLIAAAFSPEFEESGVLAFALWSGGWSLVYGTVVLLVLLRFARPASQLSLAHAYFLFLVVRTLTIAGTLLTPLNLRLYDLIPVGVLFGMDVALFFGLGSLLAWLLGNFDSHGAVSRKRAVAGLLTLYMASVVWRVVELVTAASDWSEGLFTAGALTTIGLFVMRLLIFTAAPLALIYLVHVRRSAAEGEPPEDLRVQ